MPVSGGLPQALKWRILRSRLRVPEGSPGRVIKMNRFIAMQRVMAARAGPVPRALCGTSCLASVLDNRSPGDGLRGA